MPTMKDVARVADVSIATVSASLSGASYVSPLLKQRVLDAVEALGYATNSVASGLKRGRLNLIGLVVPDITNPFHTEIVRAVQDRARQAGYAVLLVDSEQDAAREITLLKLMRSHQAAGIVLCPTGDDEHYRGLFKWVGPIPVVAVDSTVGANHYDTVVLDNEAAARLATAHIIRLGHRRIAAIVGPPHFFPSRERLAGFEKTLREALLPVDRSMIKSGHFRQEDAYHACQALLTAPRRPTAIFVANNQMLIGVMRALADRNLRCPDDLSIVSIDDFPWASAFMPKLTVVSQPIDRMAQLAIDILLARIGGDHAPTRREVLAPELKVRSSCATPAGMDVRGTDPLVVR